MENVGEGWEGTEKCENWWGRRLVLKGFGKFNGPEDAERQDLLYNVCIY